ncbi:MAG: hypothetical protein IJI59_16210 [Clostridia bacterium]|nr:hypothetical protein [Clostridia bacterium]
MSRICAVLHVNPEDIVEFVDA